MRWEKNKSQIGTNRSERFSMFHLVNFEKKNDIFENNLIALGMVKVLLYIFIFKKNLKKMILVVGDGWLDWWPRWMCNGWLKVNFLCIKS